MLSTILLTSLNKGDKIDKFHSSDKLGVVHLEI